MHCTDKYKSVKEEITAIYHENKGDTAIAASQQICITVSCP